MAYSDKEKRSLLSQLIQLATADSNLSSKEMDFISAIANSMQINEFELQDLINKPADKVVLKSESERILQFHRLVLVMNVDEQTSLKEIIAIKNFGLHMGLPAEAIDEVLSRMEHFPNKVVPPNVLIDIFKKYHN